MHLPTVEGTLAGVVLLVMSSLALVAVLNGLRPIRWTPLMLPAFFSAWLTVELAPQLIVLMLAVVTVCALVGGFSWLGLAVAGVALGGLVWMVVQSERAAHVADAALSQWVEPVEEKHAPGLLRRFFVPMAFSDPEVERIIDVPYSEASRRLKLDVYVSKDRPTAAPTLLQVHGGAWVIGDKKEQGRPLMLHLAKQGWVCFAPNYRLSPRATFPDHLIDVKRAIAWIRQHGHEYGADPGFLVLTGGSAGGHLTTLAAMTQNDPAYQPGFEDVDTSVQGCIPYYGVYDLAAETGTTAARVRKHTILAKRVLKTRDPDAFIQASPLARVHADVPPFFVIHGRNDTLVPVQEARLLVQRLREVSDRPVIYLELPGTQHAFDVFPSIRSDHVVRAVGRFCQYLRANQPAPRDQRQV
jgi:acetyl esterase/lipase